MKEDPVSRRSFLARTAILFGGAASVGGGCALTGKRPQLRNMTCVLPETGLLINPAFRTVESDGNELELFTFLASGERLSYTATGMEAELLSTIRSTPQITDLIAILAPEYGMSRTECLREVMAIMGELKAAGVVLSGNAHNTTIMETRYERTFQSNV